MSTQQQLLDALRTDHLRTDLKGRSVRGGLLTLTSQGAQFVLQSISTVVLARLLTPADFGLVAMVTAVTGLAAAFADLGLSEATIQRQDITQDQVTALFWINVGVGLGLTLITASLAPFLAWFYREPRLKDITLLLSLNFLMGGLRVQHDALLKRQMRFWSVAIRDVLSLALAVPLAILVVLKGGGYWGIIVLPLTWTFTRMALSWLMVRWVPGLPRRNAQVGSLVIFGGNVAASYLLYNLNRGADSVLIGWHLGVYPLGLYSRAYNLLMLPVRQLNIPVSSVAIPIFSRLHSDPERLARFYLRAASLIMWIATPVFGYLFVAAQPVIVLVLGRQWHAAAPVFQILVISALGQLLLDSTVWLFVSRGQSAQLFKLLLVISPIIVGSFAVGLPFGIRGVALSGSLALLAILPWILKYAFRGTPLTLTRLGQAILCPITLSFAGICLAELTLRLFAPQRIVPQLLVAALGFAMAYLLSMVARPVRKEVMSLRGLASELRVSGQTV